MRKEFAAARTIRALAWTTYSLEQLSWPSSLAVQAYSSGSCELFSHRRPQVLPFEVTLALATSVEETWVAWYALERLWENLEQVSGN